MTKYCRSDVKLLKAGCYEIRGESLRNRPSLTHSKRCLTIASACNRYWWKCHLVPKSVAVQPFNGWKGAQTRAISPGQTVVEFPQSHSLRGNDLSAPDIHSSRVQRWESYESRGCWWTGLTTTETRCLWVSTAVSFTAVWRVSQNNAFSTTRRRRRPHVAGVFWSDDWPNENDLQTAGWVVVTMWECQWKESHQVGIASDSRNGLFGTGIQWLPLEPRDAFFGGRTNAVRLHHECLVRGREDTLSRCDVTVPVGQQICTCIPRVIPTLSPRL